MVLFNTRNARVVFAWIATAAAVLCAGVGIAAQSRPLSVPPPGKAATEQIPVLREVSIDQKPDSQLPLDAEFSDAAGQPVTLRRYCPMLCTQVLGGLAGSLQGMSLAVGQDYDVLVVSFDPGETPAMAADRKKDFVRRYIRDAREQNIHFLTGREASIKALTSAVGFNAVYDTATDQWAHPAAITIVTAQGKVSRYLYGVEFAPRDLKLALVEASQGKIGGVVDQMLLFCYHYDPETGKYGLVIMNIVRAAGALTVLVLVGAIVYSLRRERLQARAV
jgi:protein SCO1/2